MNKYLKYLLYALAGWFFICGAILFIIITAYPTSWTVLISTVNGIVLIKWIVLIIALKIAKILTKNKYDGLNTIFKIVLWSLPTLLAIIGAIVNILVIGSGSTGNVLNIIKNIMHTHGL